MGVVSVFLGVVTLLLVVLVAFVSLAIDYMPPTAVVVVGGLAAAGLACGYRTPPGALRRMGMVTSTIALVIALSFVPFAGGLTQREQFAETAVIGDIRTVMQAEAAWARSNGGFYEARLECLDRPADCGLTERLASYFDPALASLAVRRGYARSFHPGAPAPPGSAARSPTSVRSYAYVAVPTAASPQRSSHRAFCGDSDGRVCFTRHAAPPGVKDGRCDPCQELR